MDIDTLLFELGSKTGLANIKLNASLVCQLTFDKKITINIESRPDKRNIEIYSVLGLLSALTDAAREGLYFKMLSSNLFGKGTQGCVLSIDENMGEIVLFKSLNIENMNYSEFEELLEIFITTAEEWTKKMAKEQNDESLKHTDPIPIGANAIFV